MMNFYHQQQNQQLRYQDQIKHQVLHDKGGGIYCSRCKTLVTLINDSCPHCGKKFSGSSRNPLLVILGLLLTLFLAGGFIILIIMLLA